ncbi:hypothetical protein E2C01_017434 [Portunus trituberculatus]|uniref:Uncharacterized protein n=1 Tax=Portunus trituberculatus TaxID=210409 RepID=A0A5B7DTF8_PORTR|nr:hypothetical protein [Portunus trituberculatus]
MFGVRAVSEDLLYSCPMALKSASLLTDTVGMVMGCRVCRAAAAACCCCCCVVVCQLAILSQPGSIFKDQRDNLSGFLWCFSADDAESLSNPDQNHENLENPDHFHYTLSLLKIVKTRSRHNDECGSFTYINGPLILFPSS